MSSYRVAHRYAIALLQSAEEEHHLEETTHDAEMIGKTVRENRELRVALASPVIDKETKKRVLGEIFGKRIGPIMLRFLNLLTEKNREGDLLAIIEQFTRLLDEKRGIVRVEVTSAVQLTETESNRLKEQLERYTGKKVVPSFRLDPTVLGGFVVRLDDRIMDATLAHQLDLLRERFLEGTYAGKHS